MMKKSYKVWSLFLVVFMLAGMMTAMTAGAIDVNEVSEGYYTSIIGPVTNESNTTKLGTGATNMGTDIACSYVTEGENTFVNASRTAYTSNKKNFIYPYEFGSNDFAFDLGSGEYVVQTKVRWTQTDGLTKPANAFFFRMEPTGGGVTYAISNKNYSNSGFGVGDTTEDYIWQGDTKAKLSDGTTNATIQLQNNTWYTVRVVYNLDEENDQLITRMEIDDANGTNLITTQNATMECTDPLKFYRVYSNIFQQATTDTGHVDFAIDDFMIVKLAKKPVTVNYDETKGTVSYHGTKAVSGAKTAVTYNENAVFTISPKTGYKVDKVLVDGEEATVAEDSTLTLATVTDAHEITVTFKDSTREYIIEPVDNTTRNLGTGESNTSDIVCEYVTENGNTFVNASRNSIADSGNKNFIYPYTYGSDDFAFDLGSGKYVVQTKVRWNQPEINSAQVYRFSIQTTGAATYDIGTSLYSHFNVRDDAQDYILQDGLVKNPNNTYDTIKLQNNTWYTIRVIYQLDEENDKIVSKMEIDDANGNNLITTPNLEKACTDPVIFRRLYTNIYPAATGINCSIDDFCIYKVLEEEVQPEDATVTVTYNEGGSVSYNGETVTSGVATTVPYNENATFTVTADEGYEVESILVNNQAVTAKDSVVLEQVTTDQTIAVTFKEKESIAPVIDSEADPIYVFGNENGGSQVAYFVINPGYGYTFTDGIAKIYEVGNTESEQNPMILNSTKMISDYANNAWDGRYGIRIYGTAIIPGNQYVLAPYWVAEDKNGNIVTIDPVGNDTDSKYIFTFGN